MKKNYVVAGSILILAAGPVFVMMGGGIFMLDVVIPMLVFGIFLVVAGVAPNAVNRVLLYLIPVLALIAGAFLLNAYLNK